MSLLFFGLCVIALIMDRPGLALLFALIMALS